MLVPGTRLRTILGSGTATVMSSHHQAVNELGEGLIVSALAEDGIVEAIEVPELPVANGSWVCSGIQRKTAPRPDNSRRYWEPSYRKA